MQCKVLCGLESLPNDTSIVRNFHYNLDFVAQILSLAILVAYEGKRLLSWDEEKLAVTYDEEKRLLSWDEEKISHSYDEEKHLLSWNEEKLAVSCDEQKAFTVLR